MEAEVNDMRELVDLPDPAVRPLVHPLDVPEASRPFRTSWLIGALTSPAVGLCVAAIIWFGAGNWVVPLIAGGTLVGFGALAGRFFRDQAWAYIPRRRQDRQRLLPLAWEFGWALVLAAVLSVALLLVAFRLDQPDVTVGVREFTFGMGAGAGLLVIIDFLGRLLRSRGAEQRRALFALPVVAAAIACTAVAYGVLFDSSGPRSSATLLWGGATMLMVGAGVAIWKYVEGRRGTEA